MNTPSTLLANLSLDAVLDAAHAEAGRDHFADESFLPNLAKVLEIPTRLPLSDMGLMGMQANSVRWLVNRLRYERDVEAHPEIVEEEVSDPVIVLGLPRSGTTKLQRFLSADPRFQATPAWAMFNPAPFPGEARGQHHERAAWTTAMMSTVTNTGESYQVMHEFDANEADESSFVPLGNFDYPMQYITAPDRPFLDWTRSRSRVPAISWLKKMLQYLQWQDGGRRDRPWLLKNPGHTGEIAEVLEVFPNATFVISQRDLATTMASSMRMMGEIMAGSFEQYDRMRIGDETVEYWSYELDRYQRQLAELGDRIRIVKTPYNRAVGDALSVARELYEVAGLAWNAQGEAAMRQWDERNPRHKLGSYGYALEDYGWNAAKIEAAFGPIAEEWRGQ